MTGKKGKSGGPRANSGGARLGAGRPKKERPPTARQYEDAIAYLDAVVSGAEQPDAVRVAAAKALLPFQSPRKRAPVASAPPRQLQQAAQLDAESAAREAWRAKSAEIRARLGRKES
jgi:hypothetical protein